MRKQQGNWLSCTVSLYRATMVTTLLLKQLIRFYSDIYIILQDLYSTFPGILITGQLVGNNFRYNYDIKYLVCFR